jgi:AcrR family transcriptional regulator
MARHKETDRKQIKSETRRKLLHAAADEIARLGYDGANINRISEAAGYAKGTIYNYFPSKRALMLELIDQTSKEHLDFIKEKVVQEKDPSRRMEIFFEAGFTYVEENLAPGKVMIGAVYGHDEEFKLHTYQAYLPFFQFVAQDILAFGVDQGVYKEMDVVSTANLLMTIYLGAGSQVDENGRPWLVPEDVAALVMDGLR